MTNVISDTSDTDILETHNIPTIKCGICRDCISIFDQGIYKTTPVIKDERCYICFNTFDDERHLPINPCSKPHNSDNLMCQVCFHTLQIQAYNDKVNEIIDDVINFDKIQNVFNIYLAEKRKNNLDPSGFDLFFMATWIVIGGLLTFWEWLIDSGLFVCGFWLSLTCFVMSVCCFQDYLLYIKIMSSLAICVLIYMYKVHPITMRNHIWTNSG